MTTVSVLLLLLAFTALVLLGWAVVLYNSLVQVRHAVEQAWSNIDVLLKQRHDELTKLVEVVKGAKDFEQQTLEKVVAARNRYAQAGNPEQALAGAQAEGLALRQLFALAENYPDLKASGSFQQLQAELARIEEAIADRRELYNAAVNINNTRLEQFPDRLLAGLARLTRRRYFQLGENERQDVALRF
jgi:LemA protein